MIRLAFTEEQVAQLRYERFHHPHPRVQTKMEAVLLKSEGLPHKEICRIVGITANTLRAYLRESLAGGVDALHSELLYLLSALAQPEPDRAVVEVRQQEDAECKILREVCHIQGSYHHMHCRRAHEAQGRTRFPPDGNSALPRMARPRFSSRDLWRRASPARSLSPRPCAWRGRPCGSP